MQGRMRDALDSRRSRLWLDVTGTVVAAVAIPREAAYRDGPRNFRQVSVTRPLD